MYNDEMPRTPYGWRTIPARREPDPTAQAAIAHMRRRRAAGAGFGSIAAWLNAQRIRGQPTYPPPEGTRWHARTVQRILERKERS